jgi:hypothetical protein
VASVAFGIGSGATWFRIGITPEDPSFANLITWHYGDPLVFSGLMTMSPGGCATPINEKGAAVPWSEHASFSISEGTLARTPLWRRVYEFLSGWVYNS